MWVKLAGPRFVHLPDGAEITNAPGGQGMLIQVRNAAREVTLVYVPTVDVDKVYAKIWQGIESGAHAIDLSEYDAIIPRDYSGPLTYARGHAASEVTPE